MKIMETYSHFNGLEYLQVRKPQLLKEIRDAIKQTDNIDYFATSFNHELAENRWRRVGTIDKTPTDFVKKRVAVELQWGKHASAACSLYAKHLALYIGDQIDVGVEILPMKSLQAQMSSEVAYYEGELHNVVRQGRGVPAVPLVLIGVDA